MADQYPTEPCQTCSVVKTCGPYVKITDYRKWLVSPVPCPDCHERLMEQARKAGRISAERQTEAVLSSVFGVTSDVAD